RGTAACARPRPLSLGALARLGRSFAGGAGLTALACLAQLLRALGPALAAAGALAVRLADDVLEVIDAVIVGEFLARLDGARRVDEDALAADRGVGIRIAGVIEVARDVAAALAVDGPAAVDLEQIAVAARLGLFRRLHVEQRPLVLGDARPLLDRLCREEAEAGERAAEAEWT